MKRLYAAALGARELSEGEVALFAQLQAKAKELNGIIAELENHVTDQHQHAQATNDIGEMERLTSAEPFKWLESAKQSLQTACMYAVRAIAQPTEL